MTDRPCPATKGHLVCCYRAGHDTSVFPHRFVERDLPEELSRDDLAVAARDNDSHAESAGLLGVLTELAIGHTAMDYVAEQRALRAVLVATRGDSFDFTRLQALRLTDTEQALMTIAQSAWVDGLACGVRAERTRGAEE